MARFGRSDAGEAGVAGGVDEGDVDVVGQLLLPAIAASEVLCAWVRVPLAGRVAAGSPIMPAPRRAPVRMPIPAVPVCEVVPGRPPAVPWPRNAEGGRHAVTVDRGGGPGPVARAGPVAGAPAGVVRQHGRREQEHSGSAGVHGRHEGRSWWSCRSWCLPGPWCVSAPGGPAALSRATSARSYVASGSNDVRSACGVVSRSAWSPSRSAASCRVRSSATPESTAIACQPFDASHSA